MQLRRAAPADVPLLAAVGAESYREHYASLWNTDELARWLDEQFSPARLAAELAGNAVVYTLVLDDEERAIGFAKTLRDRPVPTAPELRGRELQKIYFRSSMVGRGLGSRLLLHVLDEARVSGEPLVWLDVIKPNGGGVRFYERHGFERVGELPWATSRGEMGKWVMVRRL